VFGSTSLSALSASRSLFVGVLIAALSFVPSAQACTGIRLVAKDGGVVAARTLEFGVDLHSNVLVVPAGTALTGTLPDGGKSISYTTKHGFLGANAEGFTAIVDGINDQGLYVGLFYSRTMRPTRTRPRTTPPAPWRLTNTPTGCWAISPT
jgi:penicillin V acylase-like amidase (Ntn superfamily)